VEGNAVFSESPITGAEQQANVAAGYEQAGTYLINPFAAPPDFDPSPRGDMLRGPLVETSEISRYGGWNLDYEGLPRDWVRRGAISGNGAVPSLILKFNARP
jgi:hypothetical protein